MRNFKELNFTRTVQIEQDKITMSAMIPGVNSGSYTKHLYICVKVWKTRWWGRRFVYGEMRLKVPEIKALKEECEKIIAYSEKN